MDKSAIVIGAGLGGIAVSVRLAMQGYKVRVFEASGGPGGKLSNFKLGNYRFDLGPSLFTMPENVLELFRDAGKKPEDYFSYDPVPVACRYFFEDGIVINAFTNRKDFNSEIKLKLGEDERHINEYLNHSIWLYKTVAPVFLDRSLHKLKSYLNAETLKAFLNSHKMGIFTTMNRLNKRKLRHPKLVQMFNRMATYNGSNPYKVPGILTIISSLEHGTGVFYPKGGMYSITTGIVKLAEDMGVEFRYNEKVTGIIYQNNKVTGIKSGNGTYESEIVVSNMDIVPTYRNLLPGIKSPEKTLKQERSSSALVFYWGIRESFPQLDLHNIFFSKDYPKEFSFLFDKLDITDDPTIYVNISSKMDKNDAPEGHENWFVMINAPHEAGQDWDIIITRTREAVVKKLSKALNTDVAGLIAEEYVLDPRGIEKLTSSYQGSLYGTSSNSKFAAFLRHPNFTSKLKGLYFVGGSVHPGGGIPLVLKSAKICAGLIQQE